VSVNIIIRTLNEGKYLPICLHLLKEQTYEDYIITVVDSGSTDLTIPVATQNSCNVISIADYKPGKAINIGIRSQIKEYKYSVIISAHCLPSSSTWLASFVNFMDENTNVSGAYGGQLPMNYTHVDDVRDLASVIRGQTGLRDDGFFHNANSIIRNSEWINHPFDNECAHIEDIIWARQILKAKKKLAYVREATVTHFHGLHQHGDVESFRARGLVNIFKKFNIIEFFSLSKLLEPSKLRVTLIDLGDNDIDCDPLFDIVKINDLGVVSDGQSIASLIRAANREICKTRPHCIATSFFRSADDLNWNVLKKCRQTFIENFPDAVVPAYADHGNYWIEENGTFEPIQTNLAKSTQKQLVAKEELLKGAILSINALAMPECEVINHKILEFYDHV
jgi:glycosyltransferase involved in cell wall biosynthesis